MKLDEVDVKLLNALQNDAGRPAGEIAAEVGLTTSPFCRRQRLLEEAGIIRRYVTLLDQDKLGLKVSAFIAVELKSQDDETIDAFEEAIEQFPEVMECYVMTGDTDYLIRVVAADIEEYAHFLRRKLGRISAIRTIRSSLALRRVVQKTVLPLRGLETI
jgi:Lrp/AsnC family leucine-responsive transcriptional regulator